MPSFNDLETSLADGKPLRLYRFERGGLSWCFSGGPEDLMFQGRRYAASAISDDGIRLSGEASADMLTVTLPASADLVRRYQAATPADDIWLTLLETHHGLPDAAASARVAWVGRLSGIRFGNAGVAELKMQPLSASMDGDGLRLSYERNCPHCLYDTECRVVRAAFKTEAVVLVADGASVTLAVALSGYAGGYLEWQEADGGALNLRGIVEEQATAAGETRLFLLSGSAGLAPGMTVAVYPGCDQSSETCKNRFDNLDNFGGFRHMPGFSAFDGTTSYQGGA